MAFKADQKETLIEKAADPINLVSQGRIAGSYAGDSPTNKDNIANRLSRLEKDFEAYRHQSTIRMDKLEQMIRELGDFLGI